MKNIFLVFVISFISFQSYSNVLTVCNDPSRVAQFSTISSAHNAANYGDTLYVYGSPNNYPLVNLSKKLVIIGPGYNPTSANTNTAKLSGINLNGGSGGTIIMGLNLLNDIIGSNTNAVNDVIIKRCNLSSVYIFATDSNWIIENCLINYTVFLSFGNANVKAFIRNNFIQGNINGGFGTNAGYTSASNIIIQNNLFVYAYAANAFFGIHKSTIKNNIFYGLSPNGVGSDSNVFMNNISWDINNGLQSVPYGTNVGFGNFVANPLFINPIDKFLTNFNNNFRLNVGSPAKFTGLDSTDIGPTGGPSPIYPSTGPLTGMPPIPSITQMSLPVSATPQGGSIQLFIRGKKNN
jgi:hypothetical protein